MPSQKRVSEYRVQPRKTQRKSKSSRRNSASVVIRPLPSRSSTISSLSSSSYNRANVVGKKLAKMFLEDKEKRIKKASLKARHKQSKRRRIMDYDYDDDDDDDDDDCDNNDCIVAGGGRKFKRKTRKTRKKRSN